MKKNYEKPVLNSSMTGTLEGVYAAYGMGGVMLAQTNAVGTSSNKEAGDDNGGNGGNNNHHRPRVVKVVDEWFCVGPFCVPIKWHYEYR